MGTFIFDVWGNTVVEGRDTETGLCFSLMSYLTSVECFRTIVICTVVTVYWKCGMSRA